MLTRILYVNLLSSTLFPSLVRMRSSASDVDTPAPSIHSASIEKTYDIPMKDIARPLPSVLDERKVQSLMETIQVTVL